jgi:Dual specificity phosphatase, catalytic domain
MEAGVTFFIDLTFPGESSLLPYETLLPELTSRLGRLPGYLRFPIEDMSAAIEEQVAATLAALETLLTGGETVYLHCYAGRGRTGTLVGCYLVEHGWSGEEALNQIQRLRQSTSKWVAPSPETSGQIIRVLTWYPH